jgi:hypothetical protein
MTKVISLFGSEEDADRALQKLHDVGLADIDLRVIQQSAATEDAGTESPDFSLYPGPVPAAPNASGVAAPLPMDFETSFHEASEDQEEQAFFLDGVRKGGVLVIAEAGREEAERVREIFDQHHGRTSFNP